MISGIKIITGPVYRSLFHLITAQQKLNDLLDN